jgi:hypothetical protein
MSITKAKKLLRYLGISLVFFLFFGFYVYFTDTSTLQISTIPKGASISVNNKDVRDISPLTISGLRLNETVKISASLKGYHQQSREVTIDRKDQQITLILVPASKSTDIHIEPPAPSINPQFIDTLKKQPYRSKLPYWSTQYKIDYVHSNNTFTITLLRPNDLTTAEKAKVQEEAKQWLLKNGADIKNATVEFSAL